MIFYAAIALMIILSIIAIWFSLYNALYQQVVKQVDTRIISSQMNLGNGASQHLDMSQTSNAYVVYPLESIALAKHDVISDGMSSNEHPTFFSLTVNTSASSRFLQDYKNSKSALFLIATHIYKPVQLHPTKLASLVVTPGNSVVAFQCMSSIKAPWSDHPTGSCTTIPIHGPVIILGIAR